LLLSDSNTFATQTTPIDQTPEKAETTVIVGDKKN